MLRARLWQTNASRIWGLNVINRVNWIEFDERNIVAEILYRRGRERERGERRAH